jgi:hypothetical protein
MSAERQRQMADEYQAALRTLEDQAVSRIRVIMGRALANTERRVLTLLRRFAEQPDYDPSSVPGAFAGSIPVGESGTGMLRIDPIRKNEAALYLQGQLLQDLRMVLGISGPTLLQGQQLDAVLAELFDGAQELATRYGYQLVREGIEPLTTFAMQQFPGEPPEVAMEQLRERQRGQYQEGQGLTWLLDMAGALAVAERDFESLADNYAQQAAAATSNRMAASKEAMSKWWRRHGESVVFAVGAEMAAGPDPRRLKPKLAAEFGATEQAKREAVPYANVGQSLRRLNRAFHARMEMIARTETLIASGEAMDRAWDGLAVPSQVGGPGFTIDYVQYVATLDDRSCEFCVPRHGAIYRRKDVKTPIHPNCRCVLSPVTLESLAIENLLRAPGEPTWQERAAAERAAMVAKLMGANPKARLRPMGMQGGARSPQDLPLMERNKLPWGVGADAWPAGAPVWAIDERGARWNPDMSGAIDYSRMEREAAAVI